MEISFQKVSPTLATVSLVVNAEDYLADSEKNLRKTANRITIKGFRPGKAPLALVRKMFGHEVKQEAITSLISKGLKEAIEKYNISYLFEPISSGDQITKESLEKDSAYRFDFDFFTFPEVEFDNIHSIRVTRYSVHPNESDFEAFKQNYIQYANEYIDAELVDSQNCYILADIVYQETIRRQWISLDRDIVEDKKSLFVGKKVGETVEVPANQVLKPESLPLILGKDFRQEDHLSIKFEIMRVQTFKLPEGQELYNKLFGDNQVTTQEEFDKRIAEAFAKTIRERLEFVNSKSLKKKLMDAYKIEIDQDNLLRFYSMATDSRQSDVVNISDEKLAHLTDYVQWRAILNSIAKKYDIKLTFDDIVDYEIGKLEESIKSNLNKERLKSFFAKNFEENHSKFIASRDEAILKILIEKSIFTFENKVISLSELTELQNEFTNKII